VSSGLAQNASAREASVTVRIPASEMCRAPPSGWPFRLVQFLRSHSFGDAYYLSSLKPPAMLLPLLSPHFCLRFFTSRLTWRIGCRLLPRVRFTGGSGSLPTRRWRRSADSRQSRIGGARANPVQRINAARLHAGPCSCPFASFNPPSFSKSTRHLRSRIMPLGLP
jgi:hypothetical protein